MSKQCQCNELRTKLEIMELGLKKVKSQCERSAAYTDAAYAYYYANNALQEVYGKDS